MDRSLHVAATYPADGPASGTSCCRCAFSLVEPDRSDEEPEDQSTRTLTSNKKLSIVLREQQQTNEFDLDKELGALDVDDERDGVVDGHASCPVALGDEGGEPATSTVPHGKVDDQIKVVFLQVVHDAALLLFGGTLAHLLLKWPVHCFHLEP